MKVRFLFVIIILFSVTVYGKAQQYATGEKNEFTYDNQEEVDSDTPQIDAIPGGIEISVSEERKMTFQIFSITGKMVKKVDLIGKANFIELPNGCYIIKCEKWSKKMVVK